ASGPARTGRYGYSDIHPHLAPPAPGSPPSGLPSIMSSPPALRMILSSAAVLLAGVIACAASRAGQSGTGRLQIVHADTAALRKKLDSIADAHHGIVGY